MNHLLLVDDDPVQLRIRELVLQQAGFRVSIAASTDGALEALGDSGSGFDLVITDHVLPGSSGADLVRSIRRLIPALPVIVLTGAPNAVAEYEPLGVAVHLKPLHPQQLIEIVRQAVRPR